MKKTLRLIITLDCNLSCSYCCNKLPEVKSKFVTKKLNEIDFKQYDVVCITGGESLLRRDIISKLLIFNNYIRYNTLIYLYTNGLLLRESDIQVFDGINIGIHYKEQLKEILSTVNVLTDKVKLYVQDIHKEEYLPNIPDKYIKTWTMNSCFNNVETEDWILLEE